MKHGQRGEGQRTVQASKESRSNTSHLQVRIEDPRMRQHSVLHHQLHSMHTVLHEEGHGGLG